MADFKLQLLFVKKKQCKEDIFKEVVNLKILGHKPYAKDFFEKIFRLCKRV
jgi:hypothetical protein